MKAKLYLLTSIISLAVSAASAAQSAAVRMYCLSLKVEHGVSQYGHTIDLNYTGFPEGVAEFGPQWPDGADVYHDITLPDLALHGGTLAIYDGYERYSCNGSLSASVPTTDSNGNRFPDFFEVARSASYTTSGDYYWYDWKYMYSDYGQVSSAVWTRSAGATSGSYAFTFYDTTISPPNYWGTFRGTFSILEYTGTLSYTPGSNAVSGTANLVQTGAPANTWQGPIAFTKVDSDRFNSLTNDPGIWTKAGGASCSFTNHYFFRNPAYPTNYAGYIEFDDDNYRSSMYPYAIWVLSITDTNDANHNGIPDFSDDPTVVTPPRRPLISLARTSTNLLFTIRGDTNHVHQIQQVPVVTTSTWQNVTSLTLTTDPQVIPVALPSTKTFYRVVAQ
jgi:hypothetical protein